MKHILTLAATATLLTTACGKLEADKTQQPNITALKANDSLSCNSYYFQSTTPTNKFYVSTGNSIVLDNFPSDKKTTVLSDKEFVQVELNVKPRLSATSTSSSSDRKYLEMNIIYREFNGTDFIEKTNLVIPSLQQGNLNMDLTLSKHYDHDGKSYDKLALECETLIK